VVPRLLEEAQAIGRSCYPDTKRNTRGGAPADHKPSLLQDYERGRAMEIDALARAPAAFARVAGLSTPMLDLLTAMAIRQARDKGLYQQV
jgi:2-dehydropantoate 2-reductase